MRFRTKEKRIAKTQNFEALFESFISEFGLKRELNFSNIQSDWSGFVGPLLSAHCKPLRLEGDVLYVSSDHPVFANDLVMLKGDLIKKISLKYTVSLKDIRVSTRKRGK